MELQASWGFQDFKLWGFGTLELSGFRLRSFGLQAWDFEALGLGTSEDFTSAHPKTLEPQISEYFHVTPVTSLRHVTSVLRNFGKFLPSIPS
jgi:hypothetical protein